MQQFSSLFSWRLFRAQHVSGFPRPSSGAQRLQWQPLVLPSYRGDSRAVLVVGYHQDGNVKPEAAIAVFEPLMMGEETPETCWAVNKRQYNKLENCCIWLVIYLNQNHNVVLFWSISADKVKIYILCDCVFETWSTSYILLRYTLQLYKIGLIGLVDYGSWLTKGIKLKYSEWTLWKPVNMLRRLETLRSCMGSVFFNP
jgi:hypothetical protein